MKKEDLINTADLPFNGLFKALPSKRVFEEIADQVRELIFSKALKPGDRLPTEREMATHFGSGRTAVREALRVLEHTGLISIRQGNEGGIFVKNVDPHIASVSLYDTIRRADMKLEDVFTVRLPIEFLILEMVIANASPAQINQLHASIDEALALLKETKQAKTADMTLISQSNIDFHILLARATENILLEIVMESVMKFIHLFFGLVQPSYDFCCWHIGQHRTILKAISAKDVNAARKQLEEHNYAVKEHFSELLKTM